MGKVCNGCGEKKHSKEWILSRDLAKAYKRLKRWLYIVLVAWMGTLAALIMLIIR